MHVELLILHQAILTAYRLLHNTISVQPSVIPTKSFRSNCFNLHIAHYKFLFKVTKVLNAMYSHCSKTILKSFELQGV